MKYYKILSENENHYGLQFHTGRVDDPNEFQTEGSCVPGGIYFSPATSILAFVDYGPWIREVTIPEDAQMVKDPGSDSEKYRASSVVLGERERWYDPGIMQRLIDEGADIHVHGDNVLRWAAEFGHTETVKVLLENGADIHAMDDDAFRWAACNGHTETIQVLLEHGADIHARSDEALRWAAEKGNTETVMVLLDAGADVHVWDDEVLCCAAESGHTEIVRLLLDHGANVHVWDGLPIRWAAEKGYVETVALLKSYMENNPLTFCENQ